VSKILQQIFVLVLVTLGWIRGICFVIYLSVKSNQINIVLLTAANTVKRNGRSEEI